MCELPQTPLDEHLIAVCERAIFVVESLDRSCGTSGTVPPVWHISNGRERYEIISVSEIDAIPTCTCMTANNVLYM